MAGGGGEGEINLVPYLDIMVNLIMFMLVVTAYIVDLREAPVLPPAYNRGGGESAEQEAFVSVSISTAGSFAVLLSNNEVPLELPSENGKYPYGALTRRLRELRSNTELSDNLVVVPDLTVPYSVVVSTMDAVRRDEKGPLFPGVTLATAVQ